MPQMMPLSWLTLYMFFISTLLIFLFINYYSFIPKSTLISKQMNTNSMYWKW
uniref:ATP synthase F0 subunit 8 n=1 Tax=Calolamprodes beybienkoi TaxID=3037038 RepID=UPI0027993F5A|nr:ATP synthase F0 subunit 8 [Calolamprodes beybienkoi]WGO57161.1 ATP synthase F0 subunit 8 [Calolamprodes beybienkoi]